jgi:hypothetical protein
MSASLLENILIQWVPYGFGVIGILVFLVGVLRLVTGKDKAFENIFAGILIFVIGIALRFVLAYALSLL